ncbi:MAG: hypothetical protein EBY56_10120 [Actinobacteria bacterium]|nr:hypothetical protein [Actinomycetota bacterium]
MIAGPSLQTFRYPTQQTIMKHTLTLFTALLLAPLAAVTAEDVRKGGTWPPERKVFAHHVP